MSRSTHPICRMLTGRRRRALIALVTAALILIGGYVLAIAQLPIPSAVATLEVASEHTVELDPALPQALVDAEALPAAVGWQHDDEVWTNDTAAHPLASISKLVTALVALEAQPVPAGEDGPTHVWSEADQARQADYVARDSIAFPIPLGSELTTRQMLTLALLPSANDVAAAYAYSVFGDDAAFIAAVEAWKQRNGLESLVFVEPSGLDERNVASADDIVRITRLALANPLIAEIVSLPSAELPWGIGTVENTNPLFGVLPGIIGVKTGTTSAAGANLAAAQSLEVSGRDLVQISVVLAQPSGAERARASVRLLQGLETLPRSMEIVAEGERIGSLRTVDGREVPLIAEHGLSSVLVPGEQAVRTASVRAVEPGAADRDSGSITVRTPEGEETVPVVTGAGFEAPDLWWRLTHPGELLGSD